MRLNRWTCSLPIAAEFAGARQSLRDDDGEFAEDGMTIEQLRQKLVKLYALVRRMRAMNSLVAQGDTKTLRGLGYSAAQIQRMLQPVWDRQAAAFPGYKLRACFDKIRRLRVRLQTALVHFGLGKW